MFMKRCPAEIDAARQPDLACLQSLLFDEEKEPAGGRRGGGCLYPQRGSHRSRAARLTPRLPAPQSWPPCTRTRGTRTSARRTTAGPCGPTARGCGSASGTRSYEPCCCPTGRPRSAAWVSPRPLRRTGRRCSSRALPSVGPVCSRNVQSGLLSRSASPAGNYRSALADATQARKLKPDHLKAVVRGKGSAERPQSLPLRPPAPALLPWARPLAVGTPRDGTLQSVLLC